MWCAVAFVGVGGLVGSAAVAGDWSQFDFDARHSGFNPQESTIQPANVGSLHVRYSVFLPAVADGAPAFLAGVQTSGGVRDLLFLTTRNGRLLALDAATGATVWARQPATGPNYTTSSPAIDPNRQFVYSYGLEGRVHKYQVGDGTEITGGGWPQLVTLKPAVEKGSSALAVATAGSGRSYLYVANGGYPGDAGDYQGHLTTIDLGSGAQRVWNAACSDQAVHFTAGGSPDCPAVQSAIWARAGAIYDGENDRLFAATGNGNFNANAGGHDWGDSVFALRPDGSGNGPLPLDSYTPTTFQQLQDHDADLGSTAPAVLPAPSGSSVPRLAVQGGKDALLRLLDLDDLSGQGGPGHLAGELQLLAVPQDGQVLTQPAVWVNPADGSTWTFVANGNGISGLQLVIGGGGAPKLAVRWKDSAAGTSPIVANGMVFYVGPSGVSALDATSGVLLWRDASPAFIHWESPIVVNGRLYVTDQVSRLWAYEPNPPASCTADGTTLCLAGGRFQVRATWRTAGGGSGPAQAVPLTADTGYLWFFSAPNVEAVVKVLDGCALGGHFWFFAGGLTDVNVVITVIDTETGAQRVYRNQQGTPFAPIQDTSAFSTCP
ncbi:MAG TPA: PQQ-binding-like beta-propeller repeat protein [Thermoanaerobaculia bacterium]|nr:PQQ-binding-like beta-propeller repeat protein [Thermoanaerobaculia bacterium]